MSHGHGHDHEHQHAGHEEAPEAGASEHAHAAEGQDAGCGCGHAHGQVEDGVMLEGCGEGCGCAAPSGQLHPMEAAALRGFLSGVHASRLDEAELREYLEAMSGDDGSEFGRPAQLLALQLQHLKEAGGLAGEGPVAWKLLDSVAEGEEE